MVTERKEGDSKIAVVVEEAATVGKRHKAPTPCFRGKQEKSHSS